MSAAGGPWGRGAVGALLAIALFAGQARAQPGADGPSGAPGDEACLTSKINSFRQASGSPSLSVMSGLVSIARRHSADMAAAGRWYHSSDLGSKVRPLGAVKWAENVGWATDCNYMHNFFTNSTVHRNNMLNSIFTHLGVGVVASQGKIWVTEIFIRSGSASVTAPAQPPPRPSPVSQPQEAPPVPLPSPGEKASPSPTPSVLRKSPSPGPTLKVSSSRGLQSTARTRAYKDILETEPGLSELSQEQVTFDLQEGVPQVIEFALD